MQPTTSYQYRQHAGFGYMFQCMKGGGVHGEWRLEVGGFVHVGNQIFMTTHPRHIKMTSPLDGRRLYDMRIYDKMFSNEVMIL